MRHLNHDIRRAFARRLRSVVVPAVLLALAGPIFLISGDAEAQRRRPVAPPQSLDQPFRTLPLNQMFQTFPPPLPALPEVKPEESVQADVSTRSVSVTSSFTGTEIVVFGAVDNSRQTSAEAGLYDIVVVLEGASTRLVSRRKSKVAGIWINTSAVTFEDIPSYMAIASTRPLDEVADEAVLAKHEIGFDNMLMTPTVASRQAVLPGELEAFQDAVIRIKRNDGLFVQQDYGVVFTGRSLFRTSIDLPANIPVGPVKARVYLFRQGELLSQFRTQVLLERQGVERLLHTFAFEHSLWYGIFTVLTAVGAGLLASRIFRRGSH